VHVEDITGGSKHHREVMRSASRRGHREWAGD
jgi:hypothetical protein